MARLNSEQLGAIIDDSPLSGYQMMVVFLCFVLNMNDGMDVLVVSYTGPEIITEWGLPKSEMGWIFSMGLIGMTLGSFFLAPFGDKIGRRKLFLIALVLNTIGMLGVYLTTSYPQMLALRVITGLGIGGILPTMATITSEFSNKSSRDFNVGLIQGGWPQIIKRLFLSKSSWRNPDQLFKEPTKIGRVIKIEEV